MLRLATDYSNDRLDDYVIPNSMYYLSFNPIR